VLRDAQKEKQSILPLWRPAALLLAFGALAGALVWRAVDLQVLDKQFLLAQGEARHLRVVEIPAYRGVITDRNGEPLAISSPVDSVWVNPREFVAAGASAAQLGRLLDLDPVWLAGRIKERADREFFYIKRHVTPELGERVMALALPGVSLQREYRRFYPAGEVAAHVVGFTDVDDAGQEGVELAFDEWLSGESGAKRVVKDRLGRIIEDVESLRPPSRGKPLTLTIDRRLQYLAYRELKAAMLEQRARSASLVLLDVTTGEILALVNQPAYNPNNRAEINGTVSRNRAITDAFEPGSTVKPFAVAAALESGSFRVNSTIDTAPGHVRIGSYTIRDHHNLGRIDLATLIQKSSTVGAAKLALAMPSEALWGLYARLGFGTATGIGFPGEASGALPARPPKRDSERATLAYGYGLAATPLQLAQAYAALAADGVRRPVSLVKRNEAPDGEQVIDPKVAREVRRMMEAVVTEGGTATQARVPGYRIAGKTGTAKKAQAGGYAERRYVSYFAGMAPASDPRLAMVVMMDEPGAQYYYGGLVAAPVFSKVMGGALRLLNVPPDDLPALNGLVVRVEGAR
jgi:cell division protein FtsI (penicillin-binding protein 3)